MTYQIPNFSIADDAPLDERIAMKRAHVAHYEAVLARSLGNRWYDRGRRGLAQLRQELDALEAQGSADPSAPAATEVSP